jgi:non-ribosomal peptide synthase protein (TIGR01720 family)
MRWQASAELTQELLALIARERFKVEEVLIAAVVTACGRWMGERCVLIDRVGHGRINHLQELDLSRTIGWFNTVYPALVELPEDVALGTLNVALVRHIHNQLDRNLYTGVGYCLLRYLGDAEIRQRLAVLPEAQITVNYLGQLDSLWSMTGSYADGKGPLGLTMAPEDVIPFHRSGRTTRHYLLNPVGNIADGRLTVEWVYSSEVHHEKTIAALRDTMSQALYMLVQQEAVENS